MRETIEQWFEDVSLVSRVDACPPHCSDSEDKELDEDDDIVCWLTFEKDVCYIFLYIFKRWRHLYFQKWKEVCILCKVLYLKQYCYLYWHVIFH